MNGLKIFDAKMKARGQNSFGQEYKHFKHDLGSTYGQVVIKGKTLNHEMVGGKKVKQSTIMNISNVG